MPILTQTHSYSATPQDELEFAKLFTTITTYNPIERAGDEWRTIGSASGRAVPLTAKAITKAYRTGRIIGQRPASTTNVVRIDIDTTGAYHPATGGSPDEIAYALEGIGLTRCIRVQSSSSQGIHLYFPLPSAHSSWAIACAVTQALELAEVDIRAGHCEIFPNKKRYGSEYMGIRLPLQAGSCLLDEDYQPIGGHFAAFTTQWHSCAGGQDMEALEGALVGAKEEGSGRIPGYSFTRTGETNAMIPRVISYGRKHLGLKGLVELAEYAKEVLPQLPGWASFTSRKSKRKILKGRWCQDWAKCVLKHARSARAKASRDYNAEVHSDAMKRLKEVAEAVGNRFDDAHEWGTTKLGQMFSDVGKELHGVGFSFSTFYKYLSFVRTILSPQEAPEPEPKPYTHSLSSSGCNPNPVKGSSNYTPPSKHSPDKHPKGPKCHSLNVQLSSHEEKPGIKSKLSTFQAFKLSQSVVTA